VETYLREIISNIVKSQHRQMLAILYKYYYSVILRSQRRIQHHVHTRDDSEFEKSIWYRKCSDKITDTRIGLLILAEMPQGVH